MTSNQLHITDEEIPEKLGDNYRVIRLLSRGGMAKIYEGRREAVAGVTAKVAIKVISPEKSKDEKHQELFVQEAKMSSHLRHQNLIQIQDFDRQDDLYFLVMEYVDGITLRSATKRRWKHKIPASQSLIAEIGRQICEGLHHAHNAKDGDDKLIELVHRDIKPSNLMINKQGVLKILDFGISYEKKDQSGPKEIAGTRGYMSLEQVLGDDVSPRSDLFSLGIVLYELCSTEKPMFTGEEKRDKEAYIALLRSDAPVKRALELPSEFDNLKEIIIRSLQRDPRIRYQSARDMGDALAKLVPEMVQSRQDLISFIRGVEMYAEEDERELPPAFQDRTDVQFSTKKQEEKGFLLQDNFSSIFALVFPILVAFIAFGLYTLIQSTKEQNPTVQNISIQQQEIQDKKVQQKSKDQESQNLQKSNPNQVDSPIIVEESEGKSSFPSPKTTSDQNQENIRPEDKNTANSQSASEERLSNSPMQKTQESNNTKDDTIKNTTEQSTQDIPSSSESMESEDMTKLQKQSNQETNKSTATIGRLTIYSDPPGKVALDGRFVSNVGIYDYSIPYGRHQVHIVYEGKIKKFFVTIDSSTPLIYIWSFKNDEWIRKPQD